MFKIIYPVQQSAPLYIRFMHTVRNDWNSTNTYPVYEKHPDSSVSYPFYQVIRVQPYQNNVILQYLKNNSFQDDPMLRALGFSSKNDKMDQIILDKLKEGDAVMAVSSCANQHILGVALGVPFGTIDNDMIYRLSKEIEDEDMRKYMDYVSHVKYLHDIHSYLGTKKVWDMCLLSTDRTTRGFGIGKMLAKQVLVLGKERGNKYCRLDCMNSLSTIIAKTLLFKMMWVVDFKDFANYYHDAMRGIICPHSGISVYTQDLSSRKMEKFEKEVYDFDDRCRSQLIQHH